MTILRSPSIPQPSQSPVREPARANTPVAPASVQRAGGIGLTTGVLAGLAVGYAALVHSRPLDPLALALTTMHAVLAVPAALALLHGRWWAREVAYLVVALRLGHLMGVLLAQQWHLWPWLVFDTAVALSTIDLHARRTRVWCQVRPHRSLPPRPRAPHASPR